MTNIICKSCIFKAHITVTRKSVSVQGPELHVLAEMDLGSVTYRQEVVGRLSLWAGGSKFPGRWPGEKLERSPAERPGLALWSGLAVGR